MLTDSYFWTFILLQLLGKAIYVKTVLSPSIFWGPRLIARSPFRRRREKNLEPQKIDGHSIIQISLSYHKTKAKSKFSYLSMTIQCPH